MSDAEQTLVNRVERDVKRTGNAIGTKVRSLLPPTYHTFKAIAAVVIGLIIFGLGALLGTHLPWWLTLPIAAALGFALYVGAAHADYAYRCKSAAQTEAQ